MALKYVGKNPDTDWLPGVPARDLSDSEEREFPQAAKSEHYRRETKKATKPQGEE